MGFKLNPYIKCIANKVIDEHQCTIGWFVDDKKVSHKYDNDNPMIADKTKETFGRLSRTIGNIHISLGMDIMFIGGNKVTVSTSHHVDEALNYFGKTLKINVMNPQPRNPSPSPVKQRSLTMKKGALSLSRSSSRWDFHFHSYVLTIYVRLY